MQPKAGRTMTRIPGYVNEILQALERGGHEAWCVGGCVRDRFLGREPQDWDVKMCIRDRLYGVRRAPAFPAAPGGYLLIKRKAGRNFLPAPIMFIRSCGEGTGFPAGLPLRNSG